MKSFEWLYVSVYRHGNQDCTNGGISSREDHLTCFKGDLGEIVRYVDEKNIDINQCLYVVEERMSWGEKNVFLRPLEWVLNKPSDGPIMFGGNYAKGDSRWYDWFGHYLPIPIHDRKETWEQYERMSI